MNTLKYYVLTILAAFLLTFSSCDDDDDKNKGEFQAGIFVVNEGKFKNDNGSISFIHPTSWEVTQDLFGTVNNGRALGDIVQSMTIDGNFAFVVVNNSNKMEVVNANTFEAIHTVTGLKLPRNFTTLNGKGYLTEWVSFSDPGRVSIINMQSHSVTGNIAVDYGAEDIIAAGGKLYVSNSFVNSVSVIDPATATVVKTIEVGNSPTEFVLDNQNNLWVACAGGSDVNFNPLNDGKLVQINPATNAVLKTIPLGYNFSGKLAINKAGNQLFYYKGKSVYRINTTDTTAPSSVFLTEANAVSLYGIGIDPETDILYIADSESFSGDGTIFTYDMSGAAIDDYTAGLGPNGFVFKH